jgi:outer membrane protein OmpA-like peptidoglycan-associated protein
MKRQKSNSSSNENPFSLSIGDLMAGILFIFVLLLSVTMLEIQEKAEADAEISSKYNNIKSNIYLDIATEFRDNLSAWNAVVDSTELAVRFSTNEGVDTKASYFTSGSSKPSDNYKAILNDFFPRFLKVVANKDYRESIEEIRIEGHTDSDGGYLYNIQLSQDRAREVLDYCLKTVSNKSEYEEMVEWVKFKITANGLSYSHPILNADRTENKGLSRRVEFKVRTNAEKQLEEIAKIRL